MRLAILGAGEMGATHAGAYARFGKKEHAEIAAIVSRSGTKARALAKRVNAPWFTDPQKILRDDSIDAIDVTVPSDLHRKFVVAALARGKHVFCETPIALTLRDADAMIDAARANRRIFMVAQLMRFVADYQRAHDEATSGKLDKPRVVVARRLSRPYCLQNDLGRSGSTANQSSSSRSTISASRIGSSAGRSRSWRKAYRAQVA